MTEVGHFIIGTAGHVDHGKTALIRALTGIETDRPAYLKEIELAIGDQWRTVLLKLDDEVLRANLGEVLDENWPKARIRSIPFYFFLNGTTLLPATKKDPLPYGKDGHSPQVIAA